MSAADDLKEAFEGRRGKILLVGGSLAIVGYVAYTRWNGTPQEVVDPNAQTAQETDATRVPQTDPTVGNSTQGSVASLPLTNADWLSQGVDLLRGRGVPADAAFTALSKALEGSQLTAQEVSWVSQVISVLKSPPEGMPPLNSAPPTSTNVKPGAVTNIHVIGVSRDAITLDWNDSANANGYQVKRSGSTTTYTAATSSFTAAYLKPGTRYTFQVRARPKTGNTYGDWASFSASTKK